MSNCPYSSIIGSSGSQPQVTPLFPGAYLFNGKLNGGQSHTIPIYASVGKLQTTNGEYECTYTSSNAFDVANSSVYQNLLGLTTERPNVGAAVMPGFKLVLYRLIDFATPNTTDPANLLRVNTYDNSTGTDIQTYPFTTPSGKVGSVKLYSSIYPDKQLREVFQYTELTFTYGNQVLTVQVPVDENATSGNKFDVVVSGSYRLLKFYDVGRIRYTGSGSLDVSGLVVGGGGSGGSPRNALLDGTYHMGSGGGGGGGYGEGTLRIVSNVTYDISVGRGGIGMTGNATTYSGYPGGDTVITDMNGFTITAYGGGPGVINAPNNNSGGSTGGGMRENGNYSNSSISTFLKKGTTVGTNGSSMIFYGNIGGVDGYSAGGGGGGAGQAGQQGGQPGYSNLNNQYASHVGGYGGSGKTWAPTGATVYAGGGGGGGLNYGNPHGYWLSGSHGGGNFHGGGGGGDGWIGWNVNSAPGFSGCVILALPVAFVLS